MKEKAKKPKYPEGQTKDDETAWWICPTCGAWHKLDDHNDYSNYCSHCGQHIDWKSRK